MKNLRLAIRSLLHFKLYSAVNVLGLALSLACVIVIARYVHNETTVDRFNSRLDRIYVSVAEFKNDPEKAVSGIKNYHREKNFVDLRPDPAIERWSNFAYFEDQELVEGENRYTVRSVMADTNFLQILDYPVIAGSADVSAPDNLLITEEFARRVFGDSDPLGRQLTFPVTGRPLTVTGIVGPVRTKSSLEFDVIVPYSHSNYAPGKRWATGDETIVLLHPNQDYRALNAQYPEFLLSKTYPGREMRFQLFPLQNAYLDSSIGGGPYRHGNHSSVIVLSLVGLLIGLVGVFNFINIYTAVVLRRGREFGMKKVFGAPGWKVFAQLFTENILMIGLALIIALALTEVLNPAVRNLLGIEQMPFRRFDALLALGLLVGLPIVTSVFPFVHYHFAPPIRSLQSVGKTGGRGAARRVLLVFQYVLTLGMIAVSLLFLKQLNFMLNADPGYTTSDIIQTRFLRLNNWNEMNEKEQQMRALLRRIEASPLFLGTSGGTSPAGADWSRNFQLDREGSELKPLLMLSADENWLNVFGIELVQGRLFNSELDNFESFNFIVTESALPYLGITDIGVDRIKPEQPLNPAVASHEIIGVVKDFYPGSMRNQKLPILLIYWPDIFDGGDPYPAISAKIAPGRRQEAIEFLRALHAETVGGEFTYTFVEDDVAAMYAEDRKVATIYALFTAIAIAISVLGLFSLSLFDVQLRRKEIAIRKVNGATTADVLAILLKRYVYLLGIAFLIAAPAAWFAAYRYLQGFAYRTGISWWIFAVALLITAGVSLLTLIWQTRKAAGEDPARVIRSE